MKVKATAIIDNKEIQCGGTIEIHWIKRPQAYVTWTLKYNDELIASKSESIYIDDKTENDELVEKIKEKIQKFRIGRNKIFKEVIIFYN